MHPGVHPKQLLTKLVELQRHIATSSTVVTAKLPALAPLIDPKAATATHRVPVPASSPEISMESVGLLEGFERPPTPGHSTPSDDWEDWPHNNIYAHLY